MAQARPLDIVIFPRKLKHVVAKLGYCLTNPSYYGTTVLFRLRFVNRRFVVLNMSDGLSSSGAAAVPIDSGDTRSTPKSSSPHNEDKDGQEPTPTALNSQTSDNPQQRKDSRGKAAWRFEDLTLDEVEKLIAESPDYTGVVD